MLESIINSEHDNVVELFGIDAVEEAYHRASPVQKATIIKKTGDDKNPKSSRGKFLKNSHKLPKHIKSGLNSGLLRLTDYIIYSTKPLNSATIKMFEPQDVKETGVRNVSNAKLPKNQVLMVCGIIVLVGEKDPALDDAHKRVNFESITKIPTFVNGEFSLKANKKQLVPEGCSMRCFANENDHNTPLGYYELDNPRYIFDDEAFELTFEMGTDKGLNPNLVVFAALVGTITTP